MERSIDLLFVVGFLVNVLKGADLILRKHQQEWVQKKADSLARWLEQRKPLDWYTTRQGAKKIYSILLSLTAMGLAIIGYDSEKKWVAVLIFVCCTVPVISAFRGVSNQVKFQMWLDEQATLPPPDFPLQSLNRLVHRLNATPHKWLFGSKSIGDYLLRPFCLVLLGTFWIAVAFVYVGIGIYIGDSLNTFIPASGWTRWVAAISVFLLLIIGGLALFVLGFGQLMLAVFSLFIFLFTLLMLIAELLLKILRGLVLRVKEYNQGAFAAITLIVTVVLGIIEYHLKFGAHAHLP